MIRHVLTVAVLMAACSRHQEPAGPAHMEPVATVTQQTPKPDPPASAVALPSTPEAKAAPQPMPQPAAVVEPAPWIVKLADLLKPGAKLPKVAERTDGKNLYYPEVEGVSSPSLSIYQSNKAAWRIIVSAVEGGDLSREQFGDLSLCLGREKTPNGYASPKYRIEHGPLAGAIVERQIDPAHPQGYQAVILSPAYIRADSMFSSWIACLR